MTRPTAFRAGGLAHGVPALASSAPVTYLADVSEFQPDVADAVYLAWSQAIGVRALYGAQHDDGAWYGGQRRAQLHAGGARVVLIYQYLVAGQSGAAQAQAFRALVGAIRPGEIFVADAEEVSKAVLADWYNTMISQYGLGIHPYLWTYTGENFGEEQGLLPVEWIASYGSAEPSTPHKLWQFTDAYRVPGVGTADCSVFHGTISQLVALAYPAAPSPNWVFSAPQHLTIEGEANGEKLGVGPHSVKAAWSAPVGPAPEAVHHYELVVRHLGEDVGKPVEIPKGANPQVYQWNGLKPGTGYELFVRAVAVDGHASSWATVTFTTGHG